MYELYISIWTLDTSNNKMQVEDIKSILSQCLLNRGVVLMLALWNQERISNKSVTKALQMNVT